mmetsp:Transcript_2393/g.4329  ORF Transcript_2393/g.4329 Transcript_2393/m.4329 type:complete len:710 (-) Transcript_2393:51-2180(-)
MDDQAFDAMLDDMSDSESETSSNPPSPSQRSMNSTEKNFLSSLAISSKTRDSFGSFSSESTSSRNDTTSGRLATNTPRSPSSQQEGKYSSDNEDDDLSGADIGNIIMKETYSDSSSLSSRNDDYQEGAGLEEDSDDSEFDFGIREGRAKPLHTDDFTDGARGAAGNPSFAGGSRQGGSGFGGAGVGVSNLSYNNVGSRSNSVSFNSYSNNMNYGMRGESKEVDSIQAQSFGIRGATSAAIDKTTDEQLGRNIRRDLQYGRSFGVEQEEKAKKSQKKEKPSGWDMRKASEEELRHMNESKMSESKDADNDEDAILNSTKEQLIKRPSPPRNYPPVEQSSPPSPANFDSSDKRKSPLHEGYEEAKAPPPSPAPGVQESTTKNIRELNLSLPGGEGSKNGIYAASRGLLGIPGEISQEEKRMSLYKHVEKGFAMVKCYVVRSQSGVFGGKTYTMFAEPVGGGAPGGGTGEDAKDAESRFMLNAKKKSGTKHSNYVLTNDYSRQPSKETTIGKLKGDWSGAMYTMYDGGYNVKKRGAADVDGGDGEERKELGVIFYEYDRMGPGRMKVCVPRVGARGFWSDDNASILERLGDLADVEKLSAEKMPKHLKSSLIVCTNKRPKWDPGQKGHVLNFKGRVTESSVKNFQLQCDGEKETGGATMLQFGRVSKNVFTLDFGFPLNAIQAFAIALSSLDGKIADSKGYEIVRRMSTSRT